MDPPRDGGISPEPLTCTFADLDPGVEATWAGRPADARGQLSGSSPTAIGRLELVPPDQPAVESSCTAPPKPVPPLIETGFQFPYEAKTFRNARSTESCVEVIVFSHSGPEGKHGRVGTNQAVVYLGAFDPSDPRKNYLGDTGGPTGNFATPRYFSFMVPAQAEFTIVFSSLRDREEMLRQADACTDCVPGQRPQDPPGYDLYVAGCDEGAVDAGGGGGSTDRGSPPARSTSELETPTVSETTPGLSRSMPDNGSPNAAESGGQSCSAAPGAAPAFLGFAAAAVAAGFAFRRRRTR